MTIAESLARPVASTKEEAQAFLEEEVRRCLGMSAADFVREYEAGRWRDPDENPYLNYLLAVRRFAD